MCARYAFWDHSHKDLAGIPYLHQFSKYNVRPGSSEAVVVGLSSKPGKTFRIRSVRWGLSPLWTATDRRPIRVVKSETVSHQMTRHYARRRCLVPCNGWYEWSITGKHPHFFRHHEQAVLWLAGIWTGTLRDPSFAIITRPASPDLTHISPRMPVIISEGLRKGWLSDSTNRYDAIAMMRSLPYGAIEAYRTTSWVVNPMNDGPLCLHPHKEAGLSR